MPKTNQKLNFKLKKKINISDLTKPHRKKEMMKAIEEITNPYYIQALIVLLEARLEQLNQDFESYTPNH